MSNLLHPGLMLLSGSLLLLVLPDKWIKAVMPAAALCAFVAVFTLREGDGMFLQLLPQLRMQFLAVDRLSWAFVLIFAIGAVLAGLFACHTKNKFEAAAETAYAGSAMGVVLAGDWITMILFWEVMAIASWLVVISSRTEAASKAGFRYLLMHMLGGNLLLVGIVLKVSGGSFDVTCLTGSEDAAYWLMLAGTAVNAAIPPLHAWMPDAYPESTLGGTVYLGTYTTKVGIYTLIRLFAGAELLLYFGIFMALFGALMALLENDLRRLLSYHIISQLGYMVVSLALGTELGVDGAVAHVFGNILYKGTLFMCAGVILAATGKRKITEMGGLARKLPVTAVCMGIASLAICGFPLFSGFVSKGLIMNAIAESGRPLTEILMLIASVGTLLSVGLKVNYFVFFAEPREAEQAEAEKFARMTGAARPADEARTERRAAGTSSRALTAPPGIVPRNMCAAMLLGAMGCVVTGIFPQIMQGMTPFLSDGHPYTVDHITQYLELFASAAIAFVMCLPRMAPHEGITLDADWLYRKPLNVTVAAISSACEAGFSLVGRWAAAVTQKANQLICKAQGAPRGLEEDDVLQKPAGKLVALNFVMWMVITGGVFALMFCI